MGLRAPAQFAGAVVLIARDGVVLHEAAFGWAEALRLEPGGRVTAAGSPRAMTVDSVFDLASITKVAATAMAVMLLADRGSLALDTCIGEHLAGFTGPKADITVRQLLAHRLAVPWQPTWLHRVNPGDSVLTYLANEPVESIGERYQYADQSYMILGALIEQVAQQDLASFTRQEIYEPLGMTSTGYLPDASRRERCVATSHGNPYEQQMVSDLVRDGRLDRTEPFNAAYEAFGYRDYTLVGEVNDGNCHYSWSGVAGHAGLFSTAADLSVLAQMLLDGGRHGSRQLVAGDVVQEFARAPFDPTRAHGFEVNHLAAMPGALGHGGFTGTRLAFWPARQMIVVLLTNRQHRYLETPVAYPDISPLWEQVISEASGLAAGS